MTPKQPKHSSNPERAMRMVDTPFAKKVYGVVASIPKGKTLTYKQVATRAGSPGAARAVGSLMAHNYNPRIPCHRVVRSDGRVGQYNRGGPTQKAHLLMLERDVKKRI